MGGQPGASALALLGGPECVLSHALPGNGDTHSGLWAWCLILAQSVIP
jgi:hypothetical protein